MKSLVEEMGNDDFEDEMSEDDPAEQGIGKRVVGEKSPCMVVVVFTTHVLLQYASAKSKRARNSLLALR